MRPTTTALAALAALLLASCDDPRLPTQPASPPPPEATVQLSGTLGVIDAELQALIATHFPNGLETSAGTRWDNVKAKLVNNEDAVARKMTVELVRWVRQKESQMENVPAGVQRATISAKIALAMSMIVGQFDLDPEDVQPLPTIPLGADAVVAVVEPTQTTTLVTPEQEAALQFEPGSVDETTVAVLYENVAAFTQFGAIPCAGPLDTKLCQYPRFYRVAAYPQKKLNVPAHMVVCHTQNTNDHPHYASHDGFRLAHTLPAFAANYTTTDPANIRSANGENTELLPRRTGSYTTILACPESQPPTSPTMGREVQFIDQGVEHNISCLDCDLRSLTGFAVATQLAQLGAAALDLVEPDVDDVVDVDPNSHPDLGAEGVSASPTQGTPGSTVAVSFTVTNRSTLNDGGASAASEANVPVTIRLSGDAVIDASDPVLATVIAPALVPDAVFTRTESVTIPAATTFGGYYIGVLVAANQSVNGGLVEATLTNNAASTPFTVVSPVTGVTVTPESATLLVGQTAQLAAQVVPTTMGGVSWASSSPSVATVSATGLVTGVSAGNAVIRATSTVDPSKYDDAIVTVQVAQGPVAPVLVYEGLVNGNHEFRVDNWQVYPAEMFAPAPNLPPCGANTNSSRTWVDIYDANTNQRVYGFCALGTPENLNNIWVGASPGLSAVYIVLEDRLTQQRYQSNTVSLTP